MGLSTPLSTQIMEGSFSQGVNLEDITFSNTLAFQPLTL